MKRIMIINGPNLNLLGQREPGIYGTGTMAECLDGLRRRYPDVAIDYYQSNVEGFLIDKLHEVGFSYDGIALNAGAYTHTSVALHDAIRAIKLFVGAFAEACLEGEAAAADKGSEEEAMEKGAEEAAQ